MDILKFITCGSVDDGKSTLIGRLLYDSKAVSLDILNAIEAQTKNKDNGDIDLALLTDGLRAEREQGITIDVAYKYFTTPTRKFIVADAPGHVQYTRNMVTGASTVDAAIVLIDARLGVIEQTRRHSLITSLLGIPHIIVAINKMDLVNFDVEVYDAIVADYKKIAETLNMHDISFVPISALKGDNIVNKSAHTPWYEGKTLIELLEGIEINADKNLTDARFQVQYVIRPQTEELHDYRGYAGRIQSGVYTKGDKVIVQPAGIETTLTKIETNRQEVESASAGQSVILHLANDIDISRGDSILIQCALSNIKVENEISATICWFDDKRNLTTGTKLLLQHNSATSKAVVSEIEYQLDPSTLTKIDAPENVSLNDIVRVHLRTAQPIVFDNYKKNRQTGAFILINENTLNTVAAGMIDSSPA